MSTPASLRSPVGDQRVGIVSVDPAGYRATAVTREQSLIVIDTRYHVGAIHVTPVVGDQWIVRRYGQNWMLLSQLPVNTTELLAIADTPVPGLTQVGSTNPNAASPLHLNGSVVAVNAPLVLQRVEDLGVTTFDAAPSPAAPTGALVFDVTTGKPVYFDGTSWNPIGGGGTVEEVTGLQEALDSKLDASATVDDITGLPEALEASNQPVIDSVNRAFGEVPGAPVTSIEDHLTGLSSIAEAAYTNIDVQNGINTDTWAVIQQMGATMLGVIQQTSDPIVLKPPDLLSSLWFWFSGMFNQTAQANTENNPALAKVNGKLAQFEALLINNKSGGGDDFTNSALPLWASVGGITYPPVITGGYWSNGSATRAAQWVGNTVMPVESVTGKYKVYAPVTDFGYGKSRIVVQANTGFTNMVILQLERSGSGSDITVNTGNTVNTSFLAQRDLHHLSDGDLKKLDVLGVLVDETTAGGPTYRMLRNDTDIGGFQDTTAAVGTGTGHRRMALATNIDNNSFFPGCGWETFGYADL